MNEVAAAGRRKGGQAGLQLPGPLECFQERDLAAAHSAEGGRRRPVHADAAPQPNRRRGVVVPDVAGLGVEPADDPPYLGGHGLLERPPTRHDISRGRRPGPPPFRASPESASQRDVARRARDGRAPVAHQRVDGRLAEEFVMVVRAAGRLRERALAGRAPMARDVPAERRRRDDHGPSVTLRIARRSPACVRTLRIARRNRAWRSNAVRLVTPCRTRRAGRAEVIVDQVATEVCGRTTAR